MAGREQYKAQQFIDAIPGTGGIVTAIARKVGCDWYTAKKYISKYPTVRRAYDDEVESVLDLAEIKTIEAIKSGDMVTVRYYLSTKGRDRGYVDRHEAVLAGKGDEPVKVVFEWVDAESADSPT